MTSRLEDEALVLALARKRDQADAGEDHRHRDEVERVHRLAGEQRWTRRAWYGRDRLGHRRRRGAGGRFQEAARLDAHNLLDLDDLGRASDRVGLEAAAFGPATPVTELNTGSAEYPGWLSADNCRLYFGTDRQGGDIWVATRKP